jgi:hypothetical protein
MHFFLLRYIGFGSGVVATVAIVSKAGTSAPRTTCRRYGSIGRNYSKAHPLQTQE